jgi:hypothetical protein
MFIGRINYAYEETKLVDMGQTVDTGAPDCLMY